MVGQPSSHPRLSEQEQKNMKPVSNLSAVSRPASVRRSTAEPVIIRRLLIAGALIFLALFLVVPLASVFAHALAKGFGPYFQSFTDPITLASIRLTLSPR